MIDLTAVIDNEEAIRKFRELRNIARNATTSVVTDADRMDYAMQRFAATLGKIGVGVSLAGLVRQIATTRGEFQQLEVAFTTLLQNKEKADALMAEMVDLAAKTPFDLKGVADGARQLLAYGFAAEDITGTLTRLGNVAAGLGLPLERLTYLYGTTAVQGRLYARDMLQFTSSGIPVLQEMAKMYGKTTEEINEMVSAGKIGFEDVKKVIEGMTNEGGQFYNLMQEQSKTITGLISNLGDALDTMFNDIGKSQEGVIAGVLQGTISLVENYQKVLDILVPLVATYGAYKAAIMLTVAAQRVNMVVMREAVLQKALALKIGKELTAAQAVEAARMTLVTKGWKALTVAIKANTVAMLRNPVGLITTAIAALTYGLYKLITADSAQEAAQKRVNAAMDEYHQKLDEQKSKAESLHSVMNDDVSTAYSKQKAYEDLIKTYPELLKKYDEEQIKLMSLVDLTKELNRINDARKERDLEERYNNKLAEINREKQYHNTWIGKRDDYAELYELEKQLKSFRETMAAAAPADVKIATLQGNIDELTEQNKEIDRLIQEARRKAAQGQFIPYNESEAYLQEQKQSNVKTIASNQGQITKLQEGGTAVVQNKAYWENLKKEAQGAIDAMDISLKGTAEWKKLEAQIVEYDAKIKQFNTSDKTVKSVSDAQKKLAELIFANDRALEQSRLDIMKDGLNKELAEIDFQTEQRKQAISKAREEEKEASGGKLTDKREQDFATQMANLEVKANNERIAAREKYAEEYNKISKQITDSTLSEEERKYQSIKDEYEGFRKWAETAKEGGGITPDQVKELEEKIKQAETTKTLKAIVDEYGTAEDKITEIHEKAEKARQVATENGRSDLITKIAQWEKDQISAIEASVIEQSDLWKQLLGDLDRMTTDQLQEAISQARQLIANSTNLSIQDTQALLGSVENAYKKLTTRNPFKALKDAYDRYRKALKSESKDGVTSAWADVQTATQSVKSNISEITQIASDLGGILGNEVGDGISKVGSLTNDLITVFEGFGGGGASTPGGIMAWVQAGMNVATTIIGLFDDSARQAEIQAEKNRQLEGTWDSINYQVERYIDLLETAGGSEYFENAEKALSSIQKGIDLAIQSLTDFPTVAADKFTHALRVISSSSFGEKVRPSVLGITQEEYEALKRISKVLQSGDKDAIIALKENEDFWKLLPEWIQQGIDKLIDYDDQLKKTQEDINKDLFQTTTSDMEDAVISWLKNVKDGSDEASEYLEDAMRDALLESFKIEQLRPRLQEFYKKYAQYADTDQDNKLDLTADEISKLREEWKDIIDWSKEQTEGIRDVIGESSSLSAQTASTRGYQVMSQDEGEEMNGRLSDVQAKTGNILAAVEFVKSLSAEQLNRTTDIRDIMIQLNGNVADIRSYTRVLPTMNETLTSMNRKLDNL